MVRSKRLHSNVFRLLVQFHGILQFALPPKQVSHSHTPIILLHCLPDGIRNHDGQLVLIHVVCKQICQSYHSVHFQWICNHVGQECLVQRTTLANLSQIIHSFFQTFCRSRKEFAKVLIEEMGIEFNVRLLDGSNVQLQLANVLQTTHFVNDLNLQIDIAVARKSWCTKAILDLDNENRSIISENLQKLKELFCSVTYDTASNNV